jgi:excisionase family DNA binding protein
MAAKKGLKKRINGLKNKGASGSKKSKFAGKPKKGKTAKKGGRNNKGKNSRFKKPVVFRKKTKSSLKNSKKRSKAVGKSLKKRKNLKRKNSVRKAKFKSSRRDKKSFKTKSGFRRKGFNKSKKNRLNQKKALERLELKKQKTLKKLIRKVRSGKTPTADRLTSIQEYPLVLRSEFESLKIYIPDFAVETDSLPSIKRLKDSQKRKYFAMIGEQILKAWKKAEDQRGKMLQQGLPIPAPSPAHFPPDWDAEESYSPEEIAMRMKCHKDTIRRAIDRGELKSMITPGGHRRVLKSEVKRWLSDSGPRLRGRPSDQKDFTDKIK